MADVAQIRAAVARALDEDGFVLAVDGALEAVAEHARLRALGEDDFVARARAAYQAVAMESAPRDGIAIELDVDLDRPLDPVDTAPSTS